MFGTKRNTAFTWAKAAAAALDLSGKKVAVVGGTDGLGRAIAKLTAQQGADVVVVGRTNRDPAVPRLRFEQADLSLMRVARQLGAAVLPPDLDVLVLTNGIMSAPQRQVTREGLERDMAVSYLSRLAALDAYLPRLQGAAGDNPNPLRIFIMGFPGAGQVCQPGDLNAEGSYSAIGVHMQTVAGNEALVHTLKTAVAGEGGRAVEVFGLNPGLIKTNIRSNFMGQGLLARVVEWVIGWTASTPEQYAGRMVPLLFAPELSGKPGLLFDHNGNAILPTPAMETAPQQVAAFLVESRALIQKGLAATLSD